ncbi:anti-sigma-D factor RsdA [Gordonia sp. (in: high G+C Gram-positive bacteria)]|uniref:anti-sigma-D factor RsdA n=1 Tax=Gordonia sp. (in: high G+C Gram-positive bacteria) TaxID=84139 RepID=UPI0016938317|nr:anti-sigma-D factor RsdA [Gordonia sp. (in: high G+C Gram-positive bacteria)]NLG45950.1 hypothetical protein [Gordonia sp. (in: high G+C Gram-positive bacteria)]
MSEDGASTDPIDVGAVRRDDAFIDDLAAGRAAEVADSAEYELAGLIAQWRSESLAGAIPTTPTVADVEAAIARVSERERRGGLSRRLRIVSGAAAILAIAGAGLLVLSEGSQPGDPLWGVKQVVFSEEAEQTQARVNVEENIAAAKRALAAGDTVTARKLISEAEKEIGPIRNKGEVDDLRELINEVKEQNPGQLIPKLPSLPNLPPLPTLPAQTPDPTVMKVPSSSSTTSPTTPPKPPTSTTEVPTKPSTTTEKPRPTTTTSSAETVTSTSAAASTTVR